MKINVIAVWDNFEKQEIVFETPEDRPADASEFITYLHDLDFKDWRRLRRMVIIPTEQHEASLTLVRSVLTCEAAPSQWDAWDGNGQYYYLRYRHGRGTVTKFANENWHDDIKSRDPLYNGEPDIRWDDNSGNGMITLREFADKSGIYVAGSDHGWNED